jgi:hypothetical protein
MNNQNSHNRNIIMRRGVTWKCAGIMSNTGETDTGNKINTFKNLQIF